MLEIKNTEVCYLGRAIKASGNPMTIGEIDTITNDVSALVGAHMGRAKKLGRVDAGFGHDNFLSGIDVMYDVKYSMYWSMEFQRYHFNQIISSQSKMHRLTTMGKDWDSFYAMFNEYVDLDCIRKVFGLIQMYNDEENSEIKYTLFMRIISSLPMGFEMWMTVRTNYLQLKTMYHQRKNHKLREDWGPFCEWCEGLPWFKELVGID